MSVYIQRWLIRTMSYLFYLQVNEEYMKVIEMIRVALQHYDVKDKRESIRYTYKGEFSPLRIRINN